jgi:hypothetical protein
MSYIEVSMGLMPSILLVVSHPSNKLSLSSIRRYANQALKKAIQFLGARKLPEMRSKPSSYTVLDAYWARMRNVLALPCLVCRLSSSERATSVK